MNEKLIYDFTPDGTCVEACPNCVGEIECRLDGTTTCPEVLEEWIEDDFLNLEKHRIMCGQENVLPCSACKLHDFGFEVQRDMYLNSEEQDYIRSLFPEGGTWGSGSGDDSIGCDWDKETGCTVFPRGVQLISQEAHPSGVLPQIAIKLSQVNLILMR